MGTAVWARRVLVADEGCRQLACVLAVKVCLRAAPSPLPPAGWTSLMPGPYSAWPPKVAYVRLFSAPGARGDKLANLEVRVGSEFVKTDAAGRIVNNALCATLPGPLPGAGDGKQVGGGRRGWPLPSRTGRFASSMNWLPASPSTPCSTSSLSNARAGPSRATSCLCRWCRSARPSLFWPRCRCLTARRRRWTGESAPLFLHRAPAPPTVPFATALRDACSTEL